MFSKILVSITVLTTANAGFSPSQYVLQSNGIQVDSTSPVAFAGVPVGNLRFQEYSTHQLGTNSIPEFRNSIPNQPFAAQPDSEHRFQSTSVPVATEEVVGIQKHILKTVHVPYPVDKYVKVDRQVPVPVTRYIPVDRPYEVIEYIRKQYIVKVEKLVHVPIITKVKVPQPVIEVEPVIPEPQHIVKETAEHISVQPQPQYLPPPQPQSQYLPPQQSQSHYLPRTH